MDVAVSTFPVLRLPNAVILNTFRIMNHSQIFGISLLSKKTKDLVESLKLTTKKFDLMVTSTLCVGLVFPDRTIIHYILYQVSENDPIQELGTPENIIIRSENTREETWKNVMSVKQLLDHLELIYHSSTTRLFIGPNCQRFSLQSIHEHVKDFKRIFFDDNDSIINTRILSLFQPDTLELAPGSFVGGRIPSYFSIRNSDIIRAPDVQITLDDLLALNAQSIVMSSDRLFIKMLNQFLKLLVKGSNPRLEFMLLAFRQADFQDEELLRGLKYVPINRRRLFKITSEKKIVKVIGGWDILKEIDRTRITVTYRRKVDFVRFKLYVWHDHCFVN